MDSQKRLLIALGLSVGLTSLFLLLNPPTPAPTGGDSGKSATEQTAPAPSTTTPGSSAPPPQAQREPTPPTGAVPSAPPAQAREIQHDEEGVHYRVSTRGAGLVSAELQGRKMREQRRLSMMEGYKLLFGGHVPDAPQIDMASLPPMFPPSLSVGVRGAAPLDPWLVWTLDENATRENRVVLVGREGPWELRKTIEWPQSNDPSKPSAHGFDIAMTVALTNTSAQAQQGELAVHYARAVDPRNEEKP